MRVFLSAILMFFFSISASAEELDWKQANAQSGIAYDEGRLSDAATLAEKAFFLYAKKGGGYNPENHAQLLVNTDDLLFELGHRDKRVDFLEQSVPIFEEATSGQDLLLATLFTRLENAQRAVGRYEAARRSFESACKTYERLLSEADPTTLNCQIDLVKTHHRFQPRGSWALKKLEAVDRQNQNGIKNLAVEIKAKMAAADIHLAKGKEEKAIEIFQALVEKLKTLNVDEELLEGLYGRLVFAYRQARDEEAALSTLAHLALEFDGNHEAVTAVVTVDPNFQFRFRDLPVEGKIILSFSIDGDGRPVDIEVIDIDGPKYTTQTAVKTLKKWLYPPMRLNGEPVKISGFSTEFKYLAVAK